MSGAVAMDVDETDQAGNVTNQALSTAYTNEAFLTTLPEPWKTIAANAISNPTTKASIRLDQLEMSSRSHILQMLMEESETRVNDIGTTWRTALDMCHHIVHFACLAKEKKQKEMEEQKKEQEGKAEEESETTNTATEQSSSPYLDVEPRKLPLQLLEDCIDGLTLKESESLWMNYVEPSMKVLLGDLFWKSSKACHLQFLKVCNQILHRIQDSSSHYEWKGSLLLAQAKAFGIADRSAIKVWGSFRGSTKEVDEDGEESFESFDEFVAEVEDPLQGEKEYSLYKAFWSLQSDFSNPNTIQIVDFMKKMKLVLEAMESVSKSTNSSTTDATAVLPLANSESYLTSSTLFLTQLEQKEFQSQFLSQFIIVTNHLSAESPSLGSALSTLYQRSKDLLKVASPAVYHLLCDILLVQSEVHWRKWKKEQRCAPAAFATPKRLLETVGVLEPGEWEEHSKKRVQFTKEAMKGMPRMSAATKQAARQTKQSEDEAWIQQFAPVSKEEIMVACAKLKSFEPTLEEHMEDFIDAFDPDSGIEEEYHPKNDPEFSWRAMRLFAKHKLALLKLCRKPKHLEAMARQWHKDTTGKDLPGEMPESEASDSEDEEENKSDAGDDKPEIEDKKEGEEKKEEETGEEGDAINDDDDNVEKTTSEDVEMEEKDDANEESLREDDTTKDVRMKEDKDEDLSKDPLADELLEHRLSTMAESSASPTKDNETIKDKMDGDKDANSQETQESKATASNDAENADKKQETETKESDPAKDTKQETVMEEAASPIKQEATVKDEPTTSENSNKKQEEKAANLEEKPDATTAKESENGDNGSQKASQNNGLSIDKEVEEAKNRANEHDRSNGDINSNKRKHPESASSSLDNGSEDLSNKRPRDDGSLGRRSRTSSEEPRDHNNNNNDRGGSGGRDRYRSNDSRGGGRRGRSSEDSRGGGGRYDDRPHDDQRRGRDGGGRGGGGDGRYDDRGGGNRRDGGGRYDDRGGGRHDGPSRGRSRGGDRKDDEPARGSGGGAAGAAGADRFNDGPSRSRSRGGGGGGGDRKDEEPSRGGGERFHDAPRSRSRGGGDRKDDDTRGGGRRDDRFDGAPRGGGGGGGGGRRDDRANEGPRGGRGGPRGGGPRNSGGNAGGDRRFDRNKGRRGGGGGGRGGGPRR